MPLTDLPHSAPASLSGRSKACAYAGAAAIAVSWSQTNRLRRPTNALGGPTDKYTGWMESNGNHRIDVWSNGTSQSTDFSSRALSTHEFQL